MQVINPGLKIVDGQRHRAFACALRQFMDMQAAVFEELIASRLPEPPDDS
jgi:hypothetical protein